MLQYNTSVDCACGAHYQRAEARLPIKDIGVFECDLCGKVLEHWHSQIVPHYKLIPAQARKNTAA